MPTRDWLTLFGGLQLASLVPVVWTIVDVARRPPWQFSTGRKVIRGVALGIGWIFIWPLALVSSILYLAVLRRRFPRATPGRTLYGAGPQGYGQPAPVPPALPPADWYPDPAGSPRQRWWDGKGWSEHLR